VEKSITLRQMAELLHQMCFFFVCINGIDIKNRNTILDRDNFSASRFHKGPFFILRNAGITIDFLNKYSYF